MHYRVRVEECSGAVKQHDDGTFEHVTKSGSAAAPLSNISKKSTATIQREAADFKDAGDKGRQPVVGGTCSRRA